MRKQRPRSVVCECLVGFRECIFPFGPICCHFVNNYKSVNIKGAGRFFQGLLEGDKARIFWQQTARPEWGRGEIHKEQWDLVF